MTLVDVPPELRKYIARNNWKGGGQWIWDAEAMLTARGDKLEQVRTELVEKYGINPVMDVDSIYRILDRIYDLETRVKQLEGDHVRRDRRTIPR